MSPEYARRHAERIVNSGKTKEETIKEVEAELLRFYTLGKFDVLNPVNRLLKNIKEEV